MNNNEYCIIMAGGVGSRFWPISRNACPKQFLDILGTGRSFLQMTYDRFAKIIPRENILIVTADKYKDLVKEQLPEISDDNVLLEPYKRNTAPCIAYATYKLYKRNPNAVMVVAPSDHLILDESRFLSTVSSVLKHAADNDELFTIGIKPTSPNTNYGYIQANREISRLIDQQSAYQVKTFTEKPDAELAKVFVETGEFFWNSGIFIWNLKTIMQELDKCLPEVSGVFKPEMDAFDTPSETEAVEKIYADCPAISIDYGVMEKTDRVWVFLGNFGWSDLGTWRSLYEQDINKDEQGNVFRGTDLIIDNNVKNMVMIETSKDKLMVIKGLENYMVVDTNDVLMVCPREDSAVKEILMSLAVEDKAKYL